MSHQVVRMHKYAERGKTSILILGRVKNDAVSGEISKYLTGLGYNIVDFDDLIESGKVASSSLNDINGFVVVFSNTSSKDKSFDIYSSIIAADVEMSNDKKFIIPVSLSSKIKIPSIYHQYNIINIYNEYDLEKKVITIGQRVDDIVELINSKSHSLYSKKLKKSNADIGNDIRIESENLKRAILEYEFSQKKKYSGYRRLYIVSNMLVIAVSVVFTNIFFGQDFINIISDNSLSNNKYTNMIIALLIGFTFGVLVTSIASYSLIKIKKY